MATVLPSPAPSPPLGREGISLPGWVDWLALLLLCSAYLQGGIVHGQPIPGHAARRARHTRQCLF